MKIPLTIDVDTVDNSSLVFNIDSPIIENAVNN